MSPKQNFSSPETAQQIGKRKYRQLAGKLKRHIARSRLGPGDRLCTESELIKQHGLSRITVRKALAILEQDGFIYRERGNGTFVRRAIDESIDLHTERGSVIVAMPNDHNLDPSEDVACFTVFRALERELAELGFSIRIIGFGQDQHRDRNRLLRAVKDKDVRGICSLGPCVEPMRDLITSVPLIIGCAYPPTQPPWIGQDTADSTYECVRHLVDHGHRKIAVICGPWSDNATMADYAAGYRRAVMASGIPYRRDLIQHTFPGESITEVVRAVLSSESMPTAIFAEDWRICRAVLDAAEQLGLRVPDDLSLISYGQNVQGVESPVPITAYVLDNSEIGRQIAKTLAQIIDGADPPQEPIYISGKIEPRQSVRRLDSA